MPDRHARCSPPRRRAERRRNAMRLFLRLAVAVPLVLFAWPAAAQAPQPGWIADPRTGCRVWSINPQREKIAWSGSCAGGLAQGSGVVQWSLAGRPTRRYEGELRDGKENGRGVYTCHNGRPYEAESRHGQIHGPGVLTTPTHPYH